MPNYRQMYYTMMRASEKALRQIEAAQQIIIEAQQQCEDAFCEDADTSLQIVPYEKEQ